MLEDQHAGGFGPDTLACIDLVLHGSYFLNYFDFLVYCSCSEVRNMLTSDSYVRW